MKKTMKLGVLAIILTTILTGYSFAQSKNSKQKETIDPEMTPENSCVFFFPMSWYIPRDLIQIDPEFPHNRETLKLPKFYSTPLIPGSTYIFETMLIDAKVWDGSPVIEDSMTPSYLNYCENDTFKGYKLKVPEEPGFYYCYRATIRNEDGQTKDVIVVSKTIDEEFLKYYGGYYKGFIKKCAKVYAGTAWESVINEQVEVWTK